MQLTTIPALSDRSGLFFDADWSAYAITRRVRIVCRAAVVVLDLGEQLVLRLARPIPGQRPSERDGIARILCDRRQFLDLERACAAGATADTQNLAGMTAGRATLNPAAA